MGEYNSDDHYIYYCGQESLRRNGVGLIVNKSLKSSAWVQSQNWQNDLVHFQGKLFNITVIKVYAPTSNAEEAEVEWFYEDLQDLLVWTPKKDVLLIIGEWNEKVGSQEVVQVAGKFGLGQKNEAEFCQENALIIGNTYFQQDKRGLYAWTITRWSIPKSDWLYSLQTKMEKLYTVSKNKTGSWLWLRSWTQNCQIQT